MAPTTVMNPYQSVLDDLDWLWNEWWLGEPDSLTPGHIRRGSATLSLLLVNGLLQTAWKRYGFQRQPTVEAPDIVALAAHRGFRLDLAPGVIAGGARQKGIDVAFIGVFCVDKPSTRVPADADEGFAAPVTAAIRDGVSPPSPLDPLVKRVWYISEYVESPSAVRWGTIIKRREVIEYFRNYGGGVHHDLISGAKHDARRQRYELVAELQRLLQADIRDALCFELLSIGQAVAKSSDIRVLAERIRADTPGV
jgi:hypothetical protein